MKSLLLVLLASVTCISFKADNGISFSASGTHLAVDMLGNIYVYDSLLLTAYKPDGNYIARYSAMYEHKIHHVDVTNPFKIILFDRDDQIILYLDNFLSPVQEATSLRDLGIFNATAVCSASDNGFWVFDETGSELMHFDKFLNQDIVSVLTTRAGTSREAWMQESGEGLLVYLAGSGLYICDKFGQELRFIEAPGLTRPCTGSDKFYGISGLTLTIIDLINIEITTKELGSAIPKAIAVGKNGFLVLRDDKVENISFDSGY